MEDSLRFYFMKKKAMFYNKLGNKKVKCNLCSHRCTINDSKLGFCGVRQNIDGELFSLVYGEVIATNADPIEKKPLYHFLPGSRAYSIATPGCNFRCSFCQNWQISQMRKDGKNGLNGFSNRFLEPEKIVQDALDSGCESISYTYTEPTIFFEYAYDVAKIAKKNGLYNNFVTNGYITREVLEKIKPFLDAANVDLKSFSDDFYKNICKSRLEPVLDCIKNMKKLGIWVEVTTLVVPDMNDSIEELNQIADFISKIGTEIPWHISRFHPDYNFNNSTATPIQTLKNAYNIGKKHGLKYVYLGNISEDSDTYCFNCNNLVIKRSPFHLKQNNLKDGKCPICKKEINGIWK